ncbi:MAG: hypothetical protein DHS20C05_17370 [Hyphococcus sp.]|nr:MAG: hypothetical protein DHS20C05_17370 [Marinicaulis sp.]
MKIANYLRVRGRPLLWAAVAFLAITASSCGAMDPTSSNPETVKSTSTTHVVEIRQFKFVPETITVEKGDVIIWRNLDVVPHTATSEGAKWDSGNLNNENEWSLVTNVAGKTDYICAYHPTMTGSIIVTE